MISKLRLVSFFMVAFCFMISPFRAVAGIDAEWVFYNGKILTADTDDPAQFRTVQAVAVFDGKFVGVGTDQAMLALAGPTTKKIDLQGKTVLPGLIETHLHVHSQTAHHLKDMGFKDWGWTNVAIEWKDKQSVLNELRGLAASKNPGEWIVTGVREMVEGSTNLMYSAATPSLAEIDAAVPNNPLAICGGNGGYNPAVVNSQTLAILNKNYPDGGLIGIVKDKDGKPNGVLEHDAAMALQETFPAPTQKEVEDRAPAYQAELWEPAARGLTTVATRVDWHSQREYMLLDEQGKMPIRMAYAPEFAAYTGRSDFLFRRVVIAPGHGSPWLWMSGATTGTAEYGGSPNAAASCINAEYPKTSDTYKSWETNPWGAHGECRFRDGEDTLKNFFMNAVANGWVISNLHVNGDRTMDDYLTVLEEAEKKYGVKIADYRSSSDHCGWLSEQEAKRAQHLGITFSCTPASFDDVRDSGLGAYAVLYDSERAGDAYAPFKRFVIFDMKPSAHCEGHNDWTFTCIEEMVMRMDRKTGKVWGPQQRIDRRQALYTFTRWASWHTWKEKEIGSIEPGKWADLVIIDKDYMTVPEEQLSDINPLLTFVGGKIAYSEPKFASSVGLPTVGFQAPANWWQR